MFEEFQKGDKAEIEYISSRSGNKVSRSGSVVQVPESDEKSVFFIRTGDNQLTAVKNNQAFSLTISDNEEDDGSRIKRKNRLGDVESVNIKE